MGAGDRGAGKKGAGEEEGEGGGEGRRGRGGGGRRGGGGGDSWWGAGGSGKRGRGRGRARGWGGWVSAPLAGDVIMFGYLNFICLSPPDSLQKRLDERHTPAARPGAPGSHREPCQPGAVMVW